MFAAHLANSGLPEVSEIEFALTMANHAFQRWMSRCMTAATTGAGAVYCARYGRVREELLVRSVEQLGIDRAEVSRMAALMRALSGCYDQAARGAAVV